MEAGGGNAIRTFPEPANHIALSRPQIDIWSPLHPCEKSWMLLQSYVVTRQPPAATNREKLQQCGERGYSPDLLDVPGSCFSFFCFLLLLA